MNLNVGSQFSVGQLVAGAAGSILLGVLLAGLLGGALHALLHRAGAWQTSRRMEKKISWWLTVLGVGLCAMVGGWKGALAGAARVAVTVARDLGPKMLEEALQQELRKAGMTNFAQLDVKRLRELLDQAQSRPLPPLGKFGRFQPQIEEARAKLLPAAKALLDTHEQQGKLALSEVVTSLWPKVFDELIAWERGFRRAEIISGSLWVAGIEAVLALASLTMRLTQKSQSTGPPAPPRL